MSDIPEFDSGSLDIQTGLCEVVGYMGGSPANMLDPRIAPSEANLDEITDLKKELAAMREEKEQAEQIVDMMTHDIYDIEEEMAKKDDALRSKEEEVIALLRKIENLSSDVEDERQLGVETKHFEKQVLEVVYSSQNLEDLLQKISSLEAEVRNQQKRSGFFKATCERLTTMVREKDAALEVLEQSKYATIEQSHDENIFYGRGVPLQRHNSLPPNIP